MLVPAAGIGARMGGGVPKQYLPLRGATVLEQTLLRLLALPGLAGLVVVVSPDDAHWRTLAISADPRVITVHGGSRRCDSVLRGLNYLALKATADDWVLVHDAARPCVTAESIAALRSAVETHPVGAILGVPVADTLKQVGAGRDIQGTQSREQLWQAQTPQLFRYQLLHQCLARALGQGQEVTDEASALEHGGYAPLMVSGRRDNIKITHPEDLPLAELILQRQEQAP